MACGISSIYILLHRGYINHPVLLENCRVCWGEGVSFSHRLEQELKLRPSGPRSSPNRRYEGKRRSTHHPRVMWRTLAVAEGGGQGGRAGLVVAGSAAVVGGGVDGHCPHAGGVAVAVAVVVGTAVAWGPDVDVTFTVTTLWQNNIFDLTRPQIMLNFRNFFCLLNYIRIRVQTSVWGPAPVVLH